MLKENEKLKNNKKWRKTGRDSYELVRVSKGGDNWILSSDFIETLDKCWGDKVYWDELILRAIMAQSANVHLLCACPLIQPEDDCMLFVPSHSVVGAWSFLSSWSLILPLALIVGFWSLSLHFYFLTLQMSQAMLVILSSLFSHLHAQLLALLW